MEWDVQHEHLRPADYLLWSDEHLLYPYVQNLQGLPKLYYLFGGGGLRRNLKRHRSDVIVVTVEFLRRQCQLDRRSFCLSNWIGKKCREGPQIHWRDEKTERGSSGPQIPFLRDAAIFNCDDFRVLFPLRLCDVSCQWRWDLHLLLFSGQCGERFLAFGDKKVFLRFGYS